MKFQPGVPRPANAGRRKGTPNKATRAFNEALTAILEEPETEGKLRDLRDSDDAIDRSTFWRIAAKRVPALVEAKVESTALVEIIDLSGGKGQ